MSKINKLNLNNVFYALKFETPGFSFYTVDSVGDLLISIGNNTHVFDLTEIQKKNFLIENPKNNIRNYSPVLISKQNINWATDISPLIKRVYPFLKMINFSYESTIKNFIRSAKNENYKGLIINKTFNGIFVSFFGIRYFIKNEFLIKTFLFNFRNLKNSNSFETRVQKMRHWLQKQFFIITKRGLLDLSFKTVEKKISPKRNIIRNIERLNFENKTKKLKTKQKFAQLAKLTLAMKEKNKKFFNRNKIKILNASFVFHAAVIK